MSVFIKIVNRIANCGWNVRIVLKSGYVVMGQVTSLTDGIARVIGEEGSTDLDVSEIAVIQYQK